MDSRSRQWFDSFTMIFDLVFFGLPIAATLAFGNLALKDGEMKYWRCAFSFLAYCLFYLAGGREVILYMFCGAMLTHSWMPAAGAP